MFAHAHRSVAANASLLGLLVLFGPAGPARGSEATDTTIGFDEIETVMHARSPRARIIREEAEVVDARRDGALQWSNPALIYDREQSPGNAEWQLIVAKRFARPFGRSALHASWDERERAAALARQQAFADLLADLKAGYVSVRLHENHVQRLARLAELVSIAAGMARDRYEEGELSGINRHLITMADFSVRVAAREARQQYRRALADWKADMGLPPEAAITLTTPISFRPTELDPVADYAAAMRERPGLLARSALARALDAEARALKPALVPGFELFGGYKAFGEVGDGFVAGVGLDLPLFDRKGGESRAAAARGRIVRHELDRTIARRRAELDELAAAVRETQDDLAGLHDTLGREEPLSDTFLLSFREGALSLDDLLGAIQVEAGAVGDYFATLASHYENLFRLESITGVELVRFAPAQE